MAIDSYPPPAPAEEKIFARQNLFSGIYNTPVNDAINVNVYQDFLVSWVSGSPYFAMATGVDVLLNHVFEFGPFCNYILEDVKIEKSKSGIPDNILIFNSYFYCGNRFAYVPLSEKMFHPKVWLDIGLGNAQGYSRFKDLPGTDAVANYAFFVLKPGVAVEANLFSFLQWTAAVQYRLQLEVSGNSDALNSRASGLELSTGPVIHF